MPVGLVGVVISPGTTIPVGTEQDAVGEFWTVAGNDICGMEGGAVVAFQLAFLGDDSHAVTLELVDDPLFTKVVGGTVHGAGTEVALLLTEEIGAISIEGGTDGGLCLGVGGLLAETARGSE